MSDGQVVFEIKGDNSGVKQSLKDTTQAINQESQKWDSSVDNSSGLIASALIGAFTAVVTSDAFLRIGKMLVQFGVESIELASDLEEVQNVVDVTFGAEGSKRIEKWANEASAKFGLTELQAKRYSSTLGAMMKSSGMTEDQIADMSMNLAGLAADMASFYNLDFDTAFSKIQSGMAGMSMPLRQLGIDMSETAVSAFAEAEGLETAFSKMSESEQMMVRYRYLMRATADAQGDFARTSDSFANSQRRMTTGFDTLKAQLGEALLPIATQVSDAVADLLEILTYKPPETAFDVAEESIKDAAGQATQAQGILGYMDKLQEKYGSMAESTTEWKEALTKLKEVFPEVNQFIDAETGKLTATNEQLKAYIENSKQAAIEDAKKTALSSLSDQYVQAGQAYYTAEINRDMAMAQAEQAKSDLIGYIRRSDSSFTGEGLDMKQIEDVAYRVANEFGESQETIKEWVRIYNEQTVVAEQFGDQMVSLESSMNSLEADLNIAQAALERMSSAASSATSALNGLPSSAGYSSGQYYAWYYGNKHSAGLDFVPYDGYRAILHKGERIETATEASLRRSFGLQSPSFDMASVLSQIGGDVYLDGRVVGQVMSAQQAKSYKSLTRSGWRG